MKAYKIATNGNYQFDTMYWLVIADSYAEAEEKFKEEIRDKADSIHSIEECRYFQRVIL